MATRLLTPTNENAGSINDIVDLRNALLGINDTLAQSVRLNGELYDIIRHQHKKRKKVDVDRSTASATSLTLPNVWAGVLYVNTIVFGTSGPAVINIGKRQIPVTVAGAIPLAPSAMVVYAQETISIVLSGTNPTPGALFLEVIGEQADADEAGESIIR